MGGLYACVQEKIEESCDCFFERRKYELFAFSGGVNDLAAEEGEFAMKILNVVWRNGIEIAIPHGDIGVFARFERTDAVFEEKLMCGPDGVGLESSVDVNGFCHAERLRAVDSI